MSAPVVEDSGRPAAAARLRALHRAGRPLILPNVWDPVSARAFAEAGFSALATSSSAVAESLGYRDGQTPGAEMLAAVSRIARSVSVPVTADIENGYGLPPAELAARLAEAGIAGCNLEDSDPVTGTLADPARQADYLAAVRAAAGPALVVNARVDVYVRAGRSPAGPGGHAAGGVSADRGATGQGAASAADGGPLTGSALTGSAPTGEALTSGAPTSGAPTGSAPTGEALAGEAAGRANRYLAAGADCAYPILAPASALPALVRRVNGPVNALFLPGGPGLAELAAMGVARITFGGGLHRQAARAVERLAAGLAVEVGGLPSAGRPPR